MRQLISMPCRLPLHWHIRDQRPLDSKTRTTTSTRFASFGRENVVAVVILLRVLTRVSQWREQVIRSFTIFQSGEGSTSFNNDNSANFSGEKQQNEEFRGVYFLTIREKTVNQMSQSQLFSSANLKVSIMSFVHVISTGIQDRYPKIRQINNCCLYSLTSICIRSA